MSHGEEHLRQRDEVKCVANFVRVIRILVISILGVNFSHNFLALLRHFVIFCVNEFEKFIYSSVSAEEKEEGGRKEGEA